MASTRSVAPSLVVEVEELTGGASAGQRRLVRRQSDGRHLVRSSLGVSTPRLPAWQTGPLPAHQAEDGKAGRHLRAYRLYDARDGVGTDRGTFWCWAFVFSTSSRHAERDPAPTPSTTRRAALLPRSAATSRYAVREPLPRAASFAPRPSSPFTHGDTETTTAPFDVVSDAARAAGDAASVNGGRTTSNGGVPVVA